MNNPVWVYALLAAVVAGCLGLHAVLERLSQHGSRKQVIIDVVFTVAAVALAIGLERLIGVRFKMLVLWYGGFTLVVASSGHPESLYSPIREISWLRFIESDDVARYFLAAVGAVLIVLAVEFGFRPGMAR